MIAVVLLAVQAALAGIIFYYDAEMVKVVGGPIK